MPLPFLLASVLALAGPPSDDPKPPVDDFTPEPGWKKLTDSLWYDTDKNRLIMRARVVLRAGSLEHLLCLVNTKEHEAVLATSVPPRFINAGLIRTFGSPGHPVRFRPKFEPPEGPTVLIDLEWTEGGKARKASAKEWVKDSKTEKTLNIDWVFAGSEFFENPDTKERLFAADGGDLITVANFPSAILDLPFASTSNDADRLFVANTPKIPPENTFVTMVFHAPDPKSAARKKKPR